MTVMNNDQRLRLALEDVLADLRHARRSEDIGRLAFLSYCDVRRWARVARQELLATHAQQLVLDCPFANREEFIAAVDRLIAEVEQTHACFAAAA